MYLNYNKAIIINIKCIFKLLIYLCFFFYNFLKVCLIINLYIYYCLQSSTAQNRLKKYPKKCDEPLNKVSKYLTIWNICYMISELQKTIIFFWVFLNFWKFKHLLIFFIIIFIKDTGSLILEYSIYKCRHVFINK